jgi:protein SCO1/2
VAAAAKAYRAYYKKVGDGPDYSVDHSTAIYLMDPKGRFDKVIAYNLPPEEIARQIKDAMEGDSGGRGRRRRAVPLPEAVPS